MNESLPRGGGLSRRTLLRGGGVAAFAGVSLAALQLPLFSTEGAEQDPTACRAKDRSESDPRLVVSNWPAYIDPIKQPDSTLKVFQQQSGITVDYTDDVNDNAEFYAKVRNQLGTCQPVDRDIMILTDWMAARMISLGWIQPLHQDALPNVEANLIDSLRGVTWDPDLTHHVPWQSGLTGIAYNAKYVDEVGSVEELLTREDLSGRVSLLTEMRDTMTLVLRMIDADPEEFSQTEWENALDTLRRAVTDGQIRSFNGNDYLNDLAAGNIVACSAWSGDVIQVQYDNPDIKWVLPEEGFGLWSDNMLVPNLATHQANAETWMNYYYEPEVAAKLAAWNNYICPVKGAQEAMAEVDPSLVDNPLIFPTEDDLASSYGFMALDDRQSTLYERDWADVTSA